MLGAWQPRMCGLFVVLQSASAAVRNRERRLNKSDTIGPVWHAE
jgi:hypothetical protein